MPTRILDVVWMDWKQIKQAAQVFPQDDVVLFVQQEEKIIGDLADHTELPVDIPGNFKYVGNDYRLPLVDLVKHRLEAGDRERVKGFFATLNKGRWLRGKYLAKGGGNVVVQVSLEVDGTGHYTVVFIHRLVDRFGPTNKITIPTQVIVRQADSPPESDRSHTHPVPPVF